MELAPNRLVKEGRCCSCSLQTGVKILAILYMIGSVIMVLTSLFILFVQGIVDSEADRVYDDENPPTMGDKYEMAHYDRGRQNVKAIYWREKVQLVYSTLYACWFIIAMILCLGAFKGKVGACRIWLFTNPIIYILFVIHIILQEVFAQHLYMLGRHSTIDDKLLQEEKEKEKAIEAGKLGRFIALGIGILISIAFEIYLFWVVHSFIREIKKNFQGFLSVTPQYAQPRNPYPGEAEQMIHYGGSPKESQHGEMDQGLYSPPPQGPSAQQPHPIQEMEA